MKLERTLLLAFVMVLSFGHVAYADDRSKLHLVDEIFEIIKLDSQLNTIFTQLKEMQKKNLFDRLKGNKELQADSEKLMTEIFEFFEKEFTQGTYLNNCKKSYAEVFTEKELEGMVQFYKSEAGQALLKKVPEMLQKVMVMVEEMAKDLQPKIERIIEEHRERNRETKKEDSA